MGPIRRKQANPQIQRPAPPATEKLAARASAPVSSEVRSGNSGKPLPPAPQTGDPIAKSLAQMRQKRAASAQNPSALGKPSGNVVQLKADNPASGAVSQQFRMDRRDPEDPFGDGTGSDFPGEDNDNPIASAV